MTEKELKKLSRLELLELLLEISTENRALKERVASLSAEVNKSQDIRQLSAAIQQIESALKYTDHITAMVKTTAYEMSKSGNEHAMEELADTIPEPTLLDKEIYRCLLHFFDDNPEALSTLPLELKIAVSERVKAY